MRQLSGHEAGLLVADSANSNAHVSLLHVYDQATAVGGVVRFKRILAHIERRLHRAPLLRQRLQCVPLGLDHPYWVDDENFDLEYHVRHIALPKPGDWRQFCIQSARIHARALDLDRPLWEVYVIEGLDSLLDLPAGSFALLLKTHLAAVDLAGLGALTTLLHDLGASPEDPGPPQPWFAESAPGMVTLLGNGVLRSAGAPLRLARPLLRAATHLTSAAVALASEMLLRPRNLPATRFNSVVSPHRVFETRRFSEAEFDAIGSLVQGCNIDDAVRAICGGALRRYLEQNDELPPGASLAAIMPLAREADAGPGWRHLTLGTDIADALQRLQAVHAARIARPDIVSRWLDSPDLAAAGAQASAALLAWSRKLVSRAGAGLGRRTPPANCSITRVPAPAQPLFLCGAKMTYTSAILPIGDGLGLAFAVTVYDGRVVISPTSCRELMPDPEAFALCLRDSFQEYLALAEAKPQARRARSALAETEPVAARAPRAPAADLQSVRPVRPVTAARPGASIRGTARRSSPRA